jgi:hypothetical protein
MPNTNCHQRNAGEYSLWALSPAVVVIITTSSWCSFAAVLRIIVISLAAPALPAVYGVALQKSVQRLIA